MMIYPDFVQGSDFPNSIPFKKETEEHFLEQKWGRIYVYDHVFLTEDVPVSSPPGQDLDLAADNKAGRGGALETLMPK